VLAVEDVAGEDRQQRLGSDVLGHLQVFRQSHAVGRPVAPGGVAVPRTLRDGSDRRLPVEPGVEGVALQVVAARHAQQADVHGGELRHDVRAQAVRPVLVRRGKQGHDRQPDVLAGDRRAVLALFAPAESAAVVPLPSSKVQ
jgi:hypothetical protein